MVVAVVDGIPLKSSSTRRGFKTSGASFFTATNVMSLLLSMGVGEGHWSSYTADERVVLVFATIITATIAEGVRLI
jgi:hypothetical protein